MHSEISNDLFFFNPIEKQEENTPAGILFFKANRIVAGVGPTEKTLTGELKVSSL